MGTWERSVEIAAELNGKKALKAAGMHDEYLSIVRDDVCEAEGWYDWVCFDINDHFEAQTFVDNGILPIGRVTAQLVAAHGRGFVLPFDEARTSAIPRVPVPAPSGRRNGTSTLWFLCISNY